MKKNYEIPEVVMLDLEVANTILATSNKLDNSENEESGSNKFLDYIIEE